MPNKIKYSNPLSFIVKQKSDVVCAIVIIVVRATTSTNERTTIVIADVLLDVRSTPVLLLLKVTLSSLLISSILIEICSVHPPLILPTKILFDDRLGLRNICRESGKVPQNNVQHV